MSFRLIIGITLCIIAAILLIACYNFIGMNFFDKDNPYHEYEPMFAPMFWFASTMLAVPGTIIIISHFDSKKVRTNKDES